MLSPPVAFPDASGRLSITSGIIARSRAITRALRGWARRNRSGEG